MTTWFDLFNPWAWWLAPDERLLDAVAEDAFELADLHARCFGLGWGADEFERLLVDASVVTHKLDSGRRVTGFIMSRLAGDEAEILSVGVDPSERGSGRGRKLLDHHMRRLAGRGVKKLFLEVESQNAPALKLYARTGFAEVGRRKSYYARNGGPRLDALVMRRDLG
jgi:ribosomal-protein-alanine N-acetyltransferase